MTAPHPSADISALQDPPPLLDEYRRPWYHAAWSLSMAAKQKKSPQISKRQRRRIRLQQIIFIIIALAVIASWLISLIV
jgi:gluconate kinase